MRLSTLLPSALLLAAVLVAPVSAQDFRLQVQHESSNVGPARVGDRIACSGGSADGFPCAGVDLLSFLPASMIGGSGTNDSWGWTDPENGREIAIVGRFNGTAFIDITDPVNPIYLGDLPLTQGARANAWRDMKVYKDHVFIVADGAGAHGMQVFDLTRLRNPASIPTVFTEDTVYRMIGSAHNIAINEETGFAYVIGAGGPNGCNGGLHMVDINEPKVPEMVGCFGESRVGRGYTHDTQCIVYDGPSTGFTGREICFSSNEAGLSIADVTNKETVNEISATGYPNVAYSHQGWLSEDRKYFYANDEGDERSFGLLTRTIIWNVEDIEDPFVTGEYFSSNTAIDHNLYVIGDFIFEANYTSGLRILDASDPENLREAAFFDTIPNTDAPRFDGAWNVYPFFESGTLVVSGGAGVFFLQPTINGLITSNEADVPAEAQFITDLYPNPGQGRIQIGLQSDEPGAIRVAVYDIQGRRVDQLLDSVLPAGVHALTWDTGDLPGGIYLVQVEAQGRTENRRVVVQ
ncbi:MAG: choice-of-anchor B family protein [Bacteroidota bacterium]